MSKVVVIEQKSDLRNLKFVEIMVDWNTKSIRVNGPNGCLLRAIKCKNIFLIEARAREKDSAPSI